jgi:hypothetical protein
MPSTAAPARVASCTAIDPTPPAAPEMATVIPCLLDRFDGGPCGAARDVQRAGDLPRHSGRLRRQLLRGHRHVLGVARPRQREPDDVVTDSEASYPEPISATAPARSLPSPDGEGSGPSVVQEAPSDQRLAAVERRGPHLRQDLVGSGGRTRHLAHVEHVDVAVFVVAQLS